MRTRNLLIASLAAIGVLSSTSIAFANGGPNGKDEPIIGNVVGNAIPDRTVLGSDATSCTASVQRGLGHGRYARPVVRHYVIPGLAGPSDCPNMGVAVRQHRSLLDALAVTWFITPPEVTSSLYLLRDFQVVSTSQAGLYPSFIGSQDFNGDGSGDIWESTDQDEQFSTLLRQGTGFVAGPASFYTIEPLPALAFGHLGSTPGTDIVAGYVFPQLDQVGLPGSAGSGALVVFGKTGAKVLLEHDPSGNTHYTPALLDANHDGRLDVRVSGGSQPPRVYYGDGHGHFSLAP